MREFLHPSGFLLGSHERGNLTESPLNFAAAQSLSSHKIEKFESIVSIIWKQQTTKHRMAGTGELAVAPVCTTSSNCFLMVVYSVWVQG